MRWLFAVLPLSVLGAACASEGPSSDGTSAELKVVALSTYNASLGSVIEAYGSGFPQDDSYRAELAFEGQFVPDDGPARAVNFVTPARVIDRATVRWTSFGPFEQPFGSGTGEFQGTIRPRIVRKADGQVTEAAQAQSFALRVRPSLVVKEFQPSMATCAGAAKRAIGGAPYRISVEAVGFEPAAITYSITAPGVLQDPIEYKHLNNGTRDTLGAREDVVLPDVPAGRAAYAARISIRAETSRGELYYTGFTVEVRRPLEVYYNGNVEIAEAFAPVPVSACVPGGANGRDITYEETTMEMRTRSYQLNWDSHWLRTHTVSDETADTVGWMEQNGIGFSTTAGETFHWSLGASHEVGVNGSVAIPELVQAGVGARVGVNGMVGGDTSHQEMTNSNRTEGVQNQQVTTEGLMDAQSTGGGTGGGYSWSTTSADTISRTFGGKIVANTYGVFYRQTLRLLRRAAIVSYNLCGDASVVADVDFEDWAWAPDLALGPDCVPLPESNLPEAACYVDPCQGESQ